jgi:colanic acid biosynthesis glycosyl transferase WcaI
VPASPQVMPVKVLLLNQYYAPDVASTAQHAADFARALAAESHDVTVLAGHRSYHDPHKCYPGREVIDGVSVIRIAGTGFGKSSRWRRAIDFATFLLACIWHILRIRDVDVIVAMTSPPLLSVLAALARPFIGGSLHLWLMDMNPDEAVVAGWLRNGSLIARLLEALHRYSLRRAARIVVLDRFMKRRIEDKGIPADRIVVVPPWSHDIVQWDPAGRDTFRREHRLDGKFVVMYSGNHSPCHPLDSLLEAARRLRDDAGLAFCFIGGGSGFTKVQAFARDHHLENILCLPYRPLEALSASLSAADLHVVVMGNPLVGIVHPCKIYNVMSLGIPVLYIGPAESHIRDLGSREWLLPANHGAVDEIVQRILTARRRGPQRFQDECLRALEFAQSVQLMRLLKAVSGDAPAVAVPVDRPGENPCLLS